MIPPSSPTQRRATILQARYEMLDELPHVTGGRLFRARDLAFAEFVGVKQFGPGCNLPSEARRQVEATVRHLQCLPHPHLVRLYALDTEAGLLVQEWVQGISLLDLLRRRRELPVTDALPILSALPATLDYLAREAVPTPRPLLGKLFIQIDDSAALERVSTAPVEQWPGFTLKLNPLSIRSLMAAPRFDSDTTTAFVHPEQPTEISDGEGPREFARLLYELLGGRIRELDARRYSPLSALRESGNAVLRRALLSRPHANCESLWHELFSAQPELQRIVPTPPAATPSSLRPMKIPEPLLCELQAGAVLQMEPVTASTIPIRLVARPYLNIGRSSQQADFVTRLLPENEANEALTNRLSRIHAVLQIAAGRLEARDGNGKVPSLNGTSLDGHSLSPAFGSVLPGRSLLKLGQEYALELIPVYSSPRPLLISNLDASGGPAESLAGPLHGALVCVPPNARPVARHVAWIFTEAGFGLDATEDLVWDTRGGNSSPAAFHHHRGCFWLSNRALPEGAVVCDEISVHRDGIAPLVGGQTIRLGSRVYRVRLES